MQFGILNARIFSSRWSEANEKSETHDDRLDLNLKPDENSSDSNEKTTSTREPILMNGSSIATSMNT
jgi:hypothetical protein